MKNLNKTCLIFLLAGLAVVAQAAGYEVVATGFRAPENLAFDNQVNLYLSDMNRLWRLDMQGNKEQLYARDPEVDGISLGGVSLGPDGKIYFSVGNRIKALNPKGGSVSVLAEGFNFANGNCFDDAGNFYVADSNDRKLYVIPAGTKEKKLIKDKMGSAGVGVNGLVWSRNDSTLYYTQNLPSRVGGLKLNPDFTIEKEVVVTRFPLGGLDDLTMDADGNFYVCMWLNGKVMKVSPSGEKELFLEGLDGPSALAFGLGPDSSRLYVLIKGGSTRFEGTDMIEVKTDSQAYRLPFLK